MCFYKSYLGKESFVVNPDTVDAILLRVKVANFLTINAPRHTGVPSISILIIPARFHWCLLEAYTTDGMTAYQVTDPVKAANVEIPVPWRNC